MAQVPEFIEGYTLTWIGIFIGMMLASIIYAVTPPISRWWMVVNAGVFLGLAFATRPFIDWLVLP